MDAQIYRFERKQQAVWPNGNDFVDMTRSAASFATWYFGAMFSFHAAMVQLACRSLAQSGEVMK